MKKFSCILLVVLATTFAVSAQFSCSLGPALGTDINFYSGDALGGRSYRGVGVSFAAHADFQFSPVVGLMATLGFFDDMSATFKETVSGQTHKLTCKISYLTINPMLKIAIPGNGLYFVAGPGFGINVQNKMSEKITQNGAITSSRTATISNMNMRIEARAGLGYNFELGNVVVLAPQLTFGIGLNQVVTDTEWKIHSIQLALACKFKL